VSNYLRNLRRLHVWLFYLAAPSALVYTLSPRKTNPRQCKIEMSNLNAS